jgi:C_GCAxxG_C_C family probable redox protein
MLYSEPTLPDKAANYFRGGYNCAQSVLLAMQEHYDTKSEVIPKIASAFGGGVGRCGSLCGALTGAVMAIGIEHGTNGRGVEKRGQVSRLAQRFYEQFTKDLGTPFCRELIGYDLTKPEELDKAERLKVLDEKCEGFVKKAVEILLSLETQRSPERDSNPRPTAYKAIALPAELSGHINQCNNSRSIALNLLSSLQLAGIFTPVYQ